MPDMDPYGIEKFLGTQLLMSRRPLSGGGTALVGEFQFSACRPGSHSISRAYKLRIVIPPEFPTVPPVVFEIGGEIPAGGDLHVNPDKSLCLGAPLRLYHLVVKEPTISAFVENAVVPFLFSISHKQQYGNFPYGELDHGILGLLKEYEKLFRLKGEAQVAHALRYLSQKHRSVKRRPCVCGSGRPFGRCHSRHTSAFRSPCPAYRKWCGEHAAMFKSV